jgi:hypothetical protein
MPNHSNLVMMYGDPKNYEPPMNIEAARKLGYTDFTFYPSAREAVVARKAAEDSTGRETISFNEYFESGGQKYVLYVMGERPRPKPVITTLPAPARNATLDTFAVFMGEWAAKIKNAVSR